jgi:hypothetical protein
MINYTSKTIYIKTRIMRNKLKQVNQTEYEKKLVLIRIENLLGFLNCYLR